MFRRRITSNGKTVGCAKEWSRRQGLLKKYPKGEKKEIIHTYKI